MIGVIRFINSRLALKILIALTAAVAMVMGAVIFIGVANQTQELRKAMTLFGTELKSLAYAGIKHPMSVGDSETVRRQLAGMRDELREAEIVISDLNQRIVFATHPERINTPVSSFSGNAEIQHALARILATGERDGPSFFEERTTDGHRFLITIHGINNEKECHGCHDRSRKVLGGLLTRQSTDATYAAIAALRNQTILVSLLGIGAIVALTYFLLARLVTRPVVELADKAEEFAQGDMSVAVAVNTNDAVGALGRSFNFMVKSIKDQIEFANGLKSAIADPLFMVNTDMVITHMNDACAFLTGFTREETVGRLTCREIFQSDICESACPVRQCLETGEPVEGVRAVITNREGKKIPIMASASALKDSRGAIIGAVEICKDITVVLEAERLRYEKISLFSKELEREVARRTQMLRDRTLLLERANRELRELDRLKSSFLANMSHELRTPMNSIIGYTELILDGVDGEINEEQGKSLNKVINNAKHLLQLINDILDMSKIEAGKVALDIRKRDITKVIDLVVPTFEATIESKGLTLGYDVQHDLPPVYIDEDKVKQILINLLSNAVKFTETGGIVIHARPHVQGRQPGEAPLFVEVCIADTGIGIKREDMGKLFDKFSQIDASTIRQHEGTGLGLSIARGLVVLHKGVIWAESEFGKGTKLCFTLPASEDLLAKPESPIIDPIMAEKLAGYFNKPVSLFMQEPSYGGKPIKCWEYIHCGQTSCPAYGSRERRCWLIPGTHCKGLEVATCPRKAEYCKGCEIVEKMVVGDWEVMESIAGAEGEETFGMNGSKTILVIDDNPEVIEIITKYLGEEYHVVGLLSGEEAVEKAKRLHPAAITLDIMMPRKDGWQVLRELKSAPETENIPVIILSIVDDKKTGFTLGAAEYIVKPVKKDVLLQKLKNLEKLNNINKVLVADSDAATADMIGGVLASAAYQVRLAYATEDAIRAIEVSVPDVIVFNPLMSSADDVELIEYIKTRDDVKETPLILVTPRNLTEEELRELNGRIQTILHKEVLSREELLDELKDTVEKLKKWK